MGTPGEKHHSTGPLAVIGDVARHVETSVGPSNTAGCFATTCDASDTAVAGLPPSSKNVKCSGRPLMPPVLLTMSCKTSIDARSWMLVNDDPPVSGKIALM